MQTRIFYKKRSCGLGITIQITEESKRGYDNGKLCTMYEEDVRPSLKQSTWLTKENIIQKKILPYLGKRKYRNYS